MTKVLINDQSLYDIADSIRSKLNVETEYLPSEMAAAIETIQTGIELTAEDAGKVVVEDDGSYVLAVQTSIEVSSNGTYDTTTNDEVVVSVSGGGGSTNLLSGGSAPTSQDGNNGDVYIRYFDGASVPEGYKRLNSLVVGTMSGPYIDTGIIANEADGCEVVFKYSATPANDTWIFGAWQSYKDTIIGYYSSKIRIVIGGSTTVEKTFDTELHVVKATDTNLYFDGVDTGASVNWSNAPALTMQLFKDNGHSTPAKNVEIYEVTIYSNGVPVRHMVPCRRTSDDELGMYDLINDVFYTNVGSGSFSSGGTENGQIVGAYAKTNNEWQDLIGSYIYNINTGGGGGGGGSANILSGTEMPTAQQGSNGSIYLLYSDSADVSDFGIYKESSMTVSQSDNSVSFSYGSGASIGAHAYKRMDFTEIESISFTAEIGTKHYNRSSDTRFNPIVAVIPVSTGFNPASSFMSREQVSTYGVWNGGESGTTEQASVDLSEQTGECYLIIAGTGCTVSYSDISVGYYSNMILATYLKVNGAWVLIEGQDIDDVDTGGGGGGQIFTILEVLSALSAAVTLDGTALQGSQDSESSTITRFVVPSSGTLVANNGVKSDSVQAVEYLKPLAVNLFTHFMRLFDASTGTLSGNWYTRGINTVATAGKFVVAVAKTSGSPTYYTIALYTLTDYGAVGNVINGSYPAKQTYTIDDGNGSSITVYAYGGFSGGYSGNISVKISVDGEYILDDTVNDLEFFGPYTNPSTDPYASLPSYMQQEFLALLSQTA